MKILLRAIFIFLLGTVWLNASAAEWELASDTALKHQWHNAIKLNDGRVLVAGSWAWEEASHVPEVYDPATNTWIQTDWINAARASLTLLSDGRVLLAGGEVPDFYSGTVPTNTAYLFDPVTNSWTQTGSLNDAHSRHGAVLLPDGRVLLAGGLWASTKTELYDPATGTWSYGPNMVNVHTNDSLTALPDGRVLIAGSGDSEYGNYTTDAEIYDPALNQWQATASMNTVHRGKAVSLADGRVMVIGGANGSDIFDPATSSWTLTGPMSLGFESSATTLADGKVLVTGGAADDVRAEVYIPESNTWELAGDMPIARRRHTGTLLDNGQVLIVGGLQTEAVTSTLYSFNGTTPVPPPPPPPAPVSVHVADLTGSAIANGKSRWQAIATITVVDDLGNPVSNATVSGDWGTRVSGETTCVTDAMGVCSMSSDKIKYYNVIFYVVGVTHDSLDYDSGANVATHVNIDRPF